MRAFIAIDLPKGLKDYLYDLELKVKEAKITWVSKKNLHLTLKFLGEISESQLEEIKKLKTKQKKFSLSLSHIGFFPNEKAPRVFWISLDPEDKIITLQQEIDQHLLEKFPSEQKFQSHITLGRIKSIRRKKDFFESVNNIILEKNSFKVDSFQIIISTLTKNGPIYETVGKIDLS
ncbi:RNA 2',3'-cyclic phosphodiesterase [Candidatus Woesearchaeota archaeon]|nr:RNA 2',3'-cyclic phosphodiesterase [Candidatus Woesearchaeota archaeon]